jgi:uncharacterized membrane protein
MNLTTEIFTQQNDFNVSENVISKINKGEWIDIFQGLCSFKDNNIIIDYIFFKHFATKETYSIILNHIINVIDNVLINHQQFYVYVNMKNLTLIEIDKHKAFIQNISGVLKSKYPNKLTKCFICNAPYVFSQIFNLICMFIDKETQEKIELVCIKPK